MFANDHEKETWKIANYGASLDFYYFQGAGNPAMKAAYQGYIRELYSRLGNTKLSTSPPLTLNLTTAANGGFPLPGDDDIVFYLDATHDSSEFFPPTGCTEASLTFLLSARHCTYPVHVRVVQWPEYDLRSAC